LTAPKMIDSYKEKKRKVKRRLDGLKMVTVPSEGKGEAGAALKSDS
jgi:putative tryptophan/tyrosine transport system permease protein